MQKTTDPSRLGGYEMRRYRATGFVLAIAIAVGLMACGGGSNGQNQGGAPASQLVGPESPVEAQQRLENEEKEQAASAARRAEQQAAGAEEEAKQTEDAAEASAKQAEETKESPASEAAAESPSSSE
jgi:hypothetical protein